MPNEQNPVICAYCGEGFESKHEEGVHRAEQHINPNQKISQPDESTGKNIIDDKWKRGSRGQA